MDVHTPLPARGRGVPRPGTPLGDYLASSLVLEEDWELLATPDREELVACSDPLTLLDLLVRHGLITRYQADRVFAGRTFGLVLGHYRVLDRIGAGGMGVVFRGEHVRLRRQVAVKVLPPSGDEDDHRLLLRFRAEMRAVARLDHPNIVAALDDGADTDPASGSTLRYFVMEYVPGRDLEELVTAEGPLPAERACGYVYQAAAALAAAHRQNLVHRDVKPSNVRVTPDGQVKLLDFGLVRQFGQRLTVTGSALGTPEYLAPEQARDASAVDIRADIYGLGGTLYWCLTGRPPFPSRGNFVQVLTARATQPPPSLRPARPDLPVELERVLQKMMATDPENRYPTPQAVKKALLGFIDHGSHERILVPALPPAAERPSDGPEREGPAGPPGRVLVVDDSPVQRLVWASALADAGIPCDEAGDGAEAVRACETRPYDLVLTDVEMPGLTGLELCQRLRGGTADPRVKVVLFSASLTDDAMARALAAGADDYLHKGCSPLQMAERVKAALRLKQAQDRADALARRLAATNGQLEQALTARDAELFHLRSALVLGLAELAAHREAEPVTHFMRLQRYCRWLAEEAAALPAFAGQIDAPFVRLLECGAPLHDIGKVALPEHVLTKPGGWDTADRMMMQSHTVLGAETLQRVALRHGSAVAFLQVAIDVARHHHERWDGAGYPDRLAGAAIPLAARLFAVCDAYDALRTRRPYKPALAHEAAAEVILDGSPGQFDPALLTAFRRCAPQFDRTYRELPDAGR